MNGKMSAKGGSASGGRKIIIALITVLVLALAYWMASPLFIDKEVNEEFPVASNGSSIEQTEPAASEKESTISARGSFVGLANHDAEGTAILIEQDGKWYVRFENDFKVDNGPDYFVYLGTVEKHDPDARLGKLKGNIGSQNYPIPSEIDPNDYPAVWIWCRAFSVPVGKAVFN